MRRSFPITVILSLVTLFSVAQEAEEAAGPRSVSIDDLLGFRTVGDPQISPDGKWVLYVVTTQDLKSNERNSDIYRVPFAGGEPLQMTTSAKADSTPRWSPDGQTIAFLSARDGTMQIYTMPAFGGEAKKLTNHNGSVFGFAWRPDGKALVFRALAPHPGEPDLARKLESDAIVVGEGERPQVLWLLDLETKKAERITAEELSVGSFEWSPDCKYIAFTASEKPGEFESFYYSDIYLLELDKQKPELLYQNSGPDISPVFSPCGKWLAFLSRDGKLNPVGGRSLMLLDIKEREVKNLTGWFKPQIMSLFEWTKKGRIYFMAYKRTTLQFFSADPQEESISQVTEGDYFHSSVTFSTDGSLAAFARENLVNPADIYAVEIEKGGFGDPARLTRINPEIQSSMLGRPEVIKWNSVDGLEIEGILIYPIDYVQGKRYPLILKIHGGPAGIFPQVFFPLSSRSAHIFADRGWAILMPNPRGSWGYGDEFEQAVINDFGGGDYQDLMAGVDKVIDMGIADPDRLAVQGWSYGGYMTAWIITQTDRFKAAAVGAGPSNLFSMYGTTDIPDMFHWYFDGDIYGERKQLYSERSPISHINRVVTPTLIVHGQWDRRVPVGQAQEIHRALLRRNVPTKLILYPREGHVPLEISHQRDLFQRWISWFSKYVLGEEVTFVEELEDKEEEKEKESR